MAIRANFADSIPLTTVVFEAIGLKKEFDDGQVQALRGVDFRIDQGEFVAIIGPSGCGKTTLLQMLGALDRPSAGRLHYRGDVRSPNCADPAAYRAHEIGFIFQAFHLLPTFTAVENVQIPMFETSRSALRAEGARDRVAQAPSGWSIASIIFPRSSPAENGSASPSRAASPMARPCCLPTNPRAISTAKTPSIILDLIVRLHREQNMTLVLVTHDMAIARRASRTIQMKDGRIVSDSNRQPTDT